MSLKRKCRRCQVDFVPRGPRQFCDRCGAFLLDGTVWVPPEMIED